MAKATTIKTQEMIKEGYRPDVAAAAAYSMKRRGQLGPQGGYTRKTNRTPGPRGAQRFQPKGGPKKLKAT